MQLVLYGNPATKKNSMQIFRNKRTGQRYLSQSKRYKDYEKDCLKQITGKYKKNLDERYNMKCIYYRKTRHRVDLTNLLAATCDILTKAGVIEDDNCKVIVGHDGSRVRHDKDNPRVEIEITKVNDDRF